MEKAAFFDVDGTVIYGNNAILYSRLYRKKGYIKLTDYFKIYYHYLLHSLNRLDYKDMMEGTFTFLKGLDIREEILELDKFFSKVVVKQINPNVEKRMNKLKSEGYKIVFVTASPYILVKNLGDRLKVDDILSSRFEIIHYKLTGRYEKVLYGKKRFEELSRYARLNEIDLKESYFFSDSFSDKKAFEMVGNPVAVMPDRKLRKYANLKGMEIME